MNNTERTAIIITSMSKPEKRGFKLYCSTQKGEKTYICLFDIIADLATEDYTMIQKKFQKENEKKNLEIAAGYLYKLLLSFLVQNRAEKHIQTKIFLHIEKSKLLFERKLFDEANEELNIAKKQAETYEDDIMQMLISRIELHHLSAQEFPSLTEKNLVSKQMNLLNIMKYSRAINQHNFLLDILNHRLLYKQFSTPKERKEELDDLVLSELHIISNSSYSGFQAEKIHLLFQSAYYLEIGNYTSAVRNYKNLINSFEENDHLMQSPPIYYLSAIEGVLNSLLAIGIYSEMQHFMDRLYTLHKEEYSTDFLLKISWLEYYYQIMIILHTGAFEKTNDIQKAFSDKLLNKITYLPLDIQLQFHLLNTLLLLGKNNIKEAQKNITPIFSNGKIFQKTPLFKTARITNLLIQAELGDYDFVNDEIAALKRSSISSKINKTERLIFKFLQSYPLPHYQKSRDKLWEHYKTRINQIKEDKLEKRALKIFDFFAFIESKITGLPLEKILQKNHE